jgi:hypothetical protein
MIDSMGTHTSLDNDDALDLAQRKALCYIPFRSIPGCRRGSTLQDPEHSQYDIRYDQESNQALDGSYDPFARSEAQ